MTSDAFVNSLQARQLPDRDLSEIPIGQRRPIPQPLAYYQRPYRDRDQAIAKACASGGYSLKEIEDHFGLHYSRISRIVRRTRGVKGKTPLCAL